MVNMSWSVWRLLGRSLQKPKSLSRCLYVLFLLNDHFRLSLDKLKFINELSISWQDLIKMASHTQLLGVKSDVHRLSTLICHTCQFFPRSVVHDHFFRSKVDCPHFEFSHRLLCAHLCAKMKNYVLVFGRLPQVLFALLFTVSGTNKQDCIFNGLLLAYKMGPCNSGLVSELQWRKSIRSWSVSLDWLYTVFHMEE